MSGKNKGGGLQRANIPLPSDFNPTQHQPGIQRFTSAEISHAGPLPHPSVLREYNNVIPGLAERIVRMAETQSSQRIERENKALDAQIALARRNSIFIIAGQVFSFVVSMTAILGGVWVALHGQAWVGGIVGTGGLSGLVIGILNLRKGTQDAEKSKTEANGPKP
jgi:uncharacterized membrane protein